MKKYNYKNIKNKVISVVKKSSFSKNNKFTNTVWQFHILPVVEHSLKLGKKLGVDLEVLELAAYLHDYASLYNFDLYEEHHQHSAVMAEKILSKLGLPISKIEKIKDCIYSHRGSKKIVRQSLEAKILASADAMSHFSQLASMMYLAYGIHKFKTNEGAKWLKNKLARSWKKIMPEGRLMIKKDYDMAIAVLDKAIK